jgi:putative nucleotidyltransferase with HDIG domain
LKLLRQVYRVELPIVLLADQGSADLALQAINLGAADYLVRHPGYIALLPAVLENCAGQLRQSRLVAELRQAQLALQASYDSTLEGWARALELRDHETEGHSRRVTSRAVLLAQHYGLAEQELLHLRRGALLHDIGKMGVPDAILLKQGPLTEEEWRVMRLHPQLAYEMLRSIEFLQPAIDIPYCHHERWDGTGYPRMLRGEAIPIAARLFAVIDVWDALTSDRPYRRALSHEQAFVIIREGVGTHFDPEVTALFLETELWR